MVIPAYNEARRLTATLDKLQGYFVQHGQRYEIIVVDDGSTDDTAQLIAARQRRDADIRLLRHAPNRGKGYALQQGLLAARGAWVLMTDSDLSTPIEELAAFLALAQRGYDVIIGSRALADSQVVVRQVWYRQNMGRIFNLLVRLLGLSKFLDTQCGFKLFRGTVAAEISRRMTLDGFCCDVEMLLIAARLGYRVKEQPVRWYNAPESKVSPLMDAAKMFGDLLLIRGRDWLGYYNRVVGVTGPPDVHKERGEYY